MSKLNLVEPLAPTTQNETRESLIDRITAKKAKDKQETAIHIQEQLTTIDVKTFFGQDGVEPFCTREQFLKDIVLFSADEIKTLDTFFEMMKKGIRFRTSSCPKDGQSRK